MNKSSKCIVVAQALLCSTFTYAATSNSLVESSCAPSSRLTIVNTQYYDFNGQPQRGSIRVLDAIAPAVKTIFDQLYQIKFPIRSMNAKQTFNIFTYYADNLNSFNTLNKLPQLATEVEDSTSAFSCRPITGGATPSIHAYGAAIDVNSLENPYIGFSESGAFTGIIPPQGWINTNRMKYRYGKPDAIGRTEDIIDIFQNNGILYWGGFWNFPIDYMHFELKGEDARLLLAMTPEDAKNYFSLYTSFYRECKAAFPEQYKLYRFQDLTGAIYLTSGKRAGEIYKESPEILFKTAKEMIVSNKTCLPSAKSYDIQSPHGD